MNTLLNEASSQDQLLKTLEDLTFSEISADDFFKKFPEFKDKIRKPIEKVWGLKMRAGAYADTWVIKVNDKYSPYITYIDGKRKEHSGAMFVSSFLNKISGNAKEQLQLGEKLSASQPASEWIRDFIDSTNPRFKGKTKKERISMALGAHYAAQKNEACVEKGIKEAKIPSYKYDVVIAKLKDGIWDSSYDVKRGKHLEVTDNNTKKTMTIFVEEYGAGFEGTDKLRKKYIKDTPGQRIVKYMDKTNTELEEAKTFVSKGIYTLDGKKIDGARSSKLFLQALDADGFLHDLSWKEWSESDLEDTSSDSAKKQFIDRLAKQIKMFNKRIDLNSWLKGGNRSFIDTVNYIFKLDPNIKYSKAAGLKEETELEEDRLEESFADIAPVLVGLATNLGILAGGIITPMVMNYFKTDPDFLKASKIISTLASKDSDLNSLMKKVSNFEYETSPEAKSARRELMVHLKNNVDESRFNALKGHLYKASKIQGAQKNEDVQEAISKIDVEELLDAAAEMRKEFPQLRKGQSIMLTLHNMNPTLYSMAAAKHDAFTVDAKIPDLINFLDPKYYAESSDLDEAININDYMATSEKSQFGGYRPHVVDKAGKTMYLGQASYNTPDEAKDHAEDYLKQYSRGISEPRVPIKGTYGLKEEKEHYDSWIIKPRDGGQQVKVKAPDETSAIEIALGRKPSQNEIDFFNFHYILIHEKTNVSTLRNMKIVELATNCYDSDLVKEYVEQQYKSGSSVLGIKESFEKFVSNK